MWYVNQDLVLMTTPSVSGFILTMWYVNREHLEELKGIFDKFYINYVVCKLCKSCNEKVKEYKFYINYVVCKFY